MKAEIASEITKAALDCCIEQYKRVQTNPEIIGLFEEPIRKAASLTDVIVQQIKENIDQASQLQELQEYKAKKANIKRKRSKQAGH